MRILGVDPGIAIVGWGVLDSANFKYNPVAYDSITTPAGEKVENRLGAIYDALCDIMEKYKPDAMAVEELFWNTNQKTGIVVAEARGVILLAAKKHSIPIFEYTPLQVKQAVVGYGRAEKKQVITMVTALLKLSKPPKPDDTADALALAVCHANVGASPLSKYYKM
ncbi:MAG: crossover junction endodeoxyribonuclease RuvC [Clostridia bacterium]|nr:crossover junction endodeoxyribonuclease RuvC [Clostridia bacterium]